MVDWFILISINIIYTNEADFDRIPNTAPWATKFCHFILAFKLLLASHSKFCAMPVTNCKLLGNFKPSIKNWFIRVNSLFYLWFWTLQIAFFVNNNSRDSCINATIIVCDWCPAIFGKSKCQISVSTVLSKHFKSLKYVVSYLFYFLSKMFMKAILGCNCHSFSHVNLYTNLCRIITFPALHYIESVTHVIDLIGTKPLLTCVSTKQCWKKQSEILLTFFIYTSKKWNISFEVVMWNIPANLSWLQCVDLSWPGWCSWNFAGEVLKCKFVIENIFVSCSMVEFHVMLHGRVSLAGLYTIIGSKGQVLMERDISVNTSRASDAAWECWSRWWGMAWLNQAIHEPMLTIECSCLFLIFTNMLW